MSEEAVNLDSTLATPAGWFGKLPALGDFASRRLPEGFVRHWDHWLQHGLAAARAQLGPARWQEAYLVAPLLRFWLAPGAVAGAPALAGLLMPSIDRVGRHFPLTVAQPLASLAAALATPGWYAAIDGAMRRVLDTQRTLGDFEAALATVPPAVGADDASQALAARLMDQAAPPQSVWWCGDAGPAAPFRCFTGLPPHGAFAALMGAA